jgi:hypothetical protein
LVVGGGGGEAQALASDLEVMAMLRNPRMQEVLGEVRKGLGWGEGNWVVGAGQGCSELKVGGEGAYLERQVLEVMAMLRDPRMQEVLKEVRKKGQGGLGAEVGRRTSFYGAVGGLRGKRWPMKWKWWSCYAIAVCRRCLGEGKGKEDNNQCCAGPEYRSGVRSLPNIRKRKQGDSL